MRYPSFPEKVTIQVNQMADIFAIWEDIGSDNYKYN